jgi:arylsulfatase
MERPNIVLILADDLGFSDLGCYGGELHTPNLDRLGRAGVRMSQFYNTARCSPSRASLLTGKHPHQTGVGVLTRPDLPHGYAGQLSPEYPTIAELLSRGGWRTWISGKWHLAADTLEANDAWPTRRGFERFFGTLAGCSSYFDPQTLTRGEAPAADANSPDFYYTDAISREAASWIDQQSAEGEQDPFFLYLAYTAPHWPLHAREEDISANRGLFDSGWDHLRERRLAGLVDEELLEPGTRLSDRDPSQPAWGDTPDKDWEVRRMEVYAAQVEAMDRGVGEVMAALERAGRLDNTLIVFLADNGASAEELPIGELEDFVGKDLSMRIGTRDGRPVAVGNQPEIVPGPEDTYTSYGIAWANMSNAPFRKYKRWVHEGGISTPLIVHWPAGGLAGGEILHSPAQLVDVVPTLLEAAAIPAVEFEPEGRSLLSALRGGEGPERTLYWEHVGNAAIRRGRWKLVREYPTGWELYDMSVDRTELTDLADRQPQVVAELSSAWEDWADRVGVIPWDRMLENYLAMGKTAGDAEE